MLAVSIPFALGSLLSGFPSPGRREHSQAVLPHTLTWPYPFSCSSPAVLAQLLGDDFLYPMEPVWPWGGEGGQLSASPESSASQGDGEFCYGGPWYLTLASATSEV